MYINKKKEERYLKNHKKYCKKYNKTRKLEVYVSKDMKDLIKNVAKEKNLSVAAFIRKILLRTFGYIKFL